MGWDVVLLTRLGSGSINGGLEVFKVFSDIKYLFTAPLILGMLFVINLATSPGDWWVQWAALGMGIAWVVCLLRVIRAAIVVGGLAALGAWLWKRESAGRSTGTTPPRSTDSVEQA
ncbi:MAG: hypothetical protein Q7W56_06220 [Candidatus Latescibacteria bacterium]|nr:hypothetical protein [Candidatus Latescibacterota bacterium]